MDVINKIDALFDHIVNNALSETQVKSGPEGLDFANDEEVPITQYPEVLMVKDKDGKEIIMVYKMNDKYYIEPNRGPKKEFINIKNLVTNLNMNGFKWFAGFNRV